MVLCPGFIDLHAHSDLQILREPSMSCKTHQGILTEISGNCGIGVFPINKDFPKALVFDILGKYEDFNWKDFASYKANIKSDYDMRMLTSHSALRYFSMKGNANRPATDNEIKKMQQQLQIAFDQGSIGLSMGSYYAPSVFAEEKELIALATIVEKNDKIMSVHHRCEGSDIISSLQQIIRVAEKAGAKLEISHLKIIGDKNQHLLPQIFSLLENSSSVIGFDQYPFEYGTTSLSALLPPYLLAMDSIQRSKYLADKSNYKAIINEIENPNNWDSIINLVSFSKIFITELTHFPELLGKSLEEMGNYYNTSPYFALFKVLSEETGEALMLDYTESLDTLGQIFRHPMSAFGTDALYNGLHTHPRCYNSTNHILDSRFLSLHKTNLNWAIRRMTGLCSDRFNLKDVGYIKPGYKANLVCFNPTKIKDNSTIAEPNAAPVGFKYIFQNGKLIKLS